MTMRPNGRLSLSPEGAASLTFSFEMSATLTLPMDCFAGDRTCMGFQNEINNEGDDGPQNWLCNMDADTGACVCTVSDTQADPAQVGTWEAGNDNNIIVDFMDDDGPASLSFCVDGDTLHIQPPADEEGPGPVFHLAREE
jgi:hypothetical protein